MPTRIKKISEFSSLIELKSRWNVHKGKLISKFPRPCTLKLTWSRQPAPMQLQTDKVHKDKIILKFPPSWNFELIWNVHKGRMTSKFLSRHIITSGRVTPRRVTPRHVTPRHVTSCCHVMLSRHVVTSCCHVILSRHLVTSSGHVILSCIDSVTSSRHVITSRHHVTSSRHVITSRHVTSSTSPRPVARPNREPCFSLAGLSTASEGFNLCGPRFF